MTRIYPATTLFIDSEKIYVNIVTKDEFNKILNDEDETLDFGLDDNKEYYFVNKLVHGEHNAFWACSARKNESEEPSIEIIEDPTDEISQFDQFMLNLGEYTLNDFESDDSAFWLYKTIHRCIMPSTSTSEKHIESNKLLMYCFLNNHWRAFFEDVLYENFNYMNVCDYITDYLNRCFI